MGRNLRDLILRGQSKRDILLSWKLGQQKRCPFFMPCSGERPGLSSLIALQEGIGAGYILQVAGPEENIEKEEFDERGYECYQ